jgi:hypothetical protein
MTHPSFLHMVEEYIAFRNGLGFDLETSRWMLLDFARYADRIGHQGPVTIDLAVHWALSSRSSDPAQAARRLAAVRQFLRHRSTFDPATEVPPAGLLGRVPRRKQPHIYSDAEVADLLRRPVSCCLATGFAPRRTSRSSRSWFRLDCGFPRPAASSTTTSI